MQGDWSEQQQDSRPSHGSRRGPREMELTPYESSTGPKHDSSRLTGGKKTLCQLTGTIEKTNGVSEMTLDDMERFKW